MGSCEVELKAIAQDLELFPFFLGTFDKYFPGFINKNKMCCAIVNTASRQTGGVHWLAFGWFPAKQTFYLFDPFGFSDAKLKQLYSFQYEGLMKRSAISSTPDRCITLVRTDKAVQGPYSAACGLFCLLFLYAFTRWPNAPFDKNPAFGPLRAVSSQLLLTPKAQDAFCANQKFLYTFLWKHSAYFRHHADVIMKNTAVNKLSAHQ